MGWLHCSWNKTSQLWFLSDYNLGTAWPYVHIWDIMHLPGQSTALWNMSSSHAHAELQPSLKYQNWRYTDEYCLLALQVKQCNPLCLHHNLNPIIPEAIKLIHSSLLGDCGWIIADIAFPSKYLKISTSFTINYNVYVILRDSWSRPSTELDDIGLRKMHSGCKTIFIYISISFWGWFACFCFLLRISPLLPSLQISNDKRSWPHFS